MISLTFLVIYKFYHGQLYLLQIFFQKLYSLGPVLKIFNTRRINNLGLLNNTEVLRVKTKKIVLSTFSNVEVTEVITFHQPDDDIVSMRFSCVECQENADTTVPDAVHHEIKNIQKFFSTLRDYMYQLYHDLQTSLITTGMTIIVIIVL